MKTPLALLVLALPAFAQSGTFTFADAPTSNAHTITLPAPDAGNATLTITATSTFTQTLNVWNNGLTPVDGGCVFGNTLRITDSAGVELAEASSRVSIPLWCDGSDQATGTAVSAIADGCTVPIPADRTFVVHSLTRSVTTFTQPFGGALVTQTISRAGVAGTWSYGP